MLLNGSPKLPRLPMPSALDHESFDITLHRRDNEGFGFVILTSKSKPPYGSKSPDPALFLVCINPLKKSTKSAFTEMLIRKNKDTKRSFWTRITTVSKRLPLVC